VAIAARLEQDVDDLAVLIDGAPKVLAPAADSHEEFVEMPGVADGPGAVSKPPGITRPANASHQFHQSG
jgi:hypothetical protein